MLLVKHRQSKKKPMKAILMENLKNLKNLSQEGRCLNQEVTKVKSMMRAALDL